MMNAQQNIFVVFKSITNTLNQEIKVLLFATDDQKLASDEAKRLDEELTSAERYQNSACVKYEVLPILSRRKTRHPFMRNSHKAVFDIESVEKNGNTVDGNVTREPVKQRGRLLYGQHAALLSRN